MHDINSLRCWFNFCFKRWYNTGLLNSFINIASFFKIQALYQEFLSTRCSILHFFMVFSQVQFFLYFIMLLTSSYNKLRHFLCFWQCMKSSAKLKKISRQFFPMIVFVLYPLSLSISFISLGHYFPTVILEIMGLHSWILWAITPIQNITDSTQKIGMQSWISIWKIWKHLQRVWVIGDTNISFFLRSSFLWTR